MSRLKGFDRYGHEFDEHHWSAFISLHHEPALSVRADGSVKFPSRSDATPASSRFLMHWRGKGYFRFSTSDLEVQISWASPRTGNLYLAHSAEDGSIIQEWRQSYQLIMVDSEWRVVASIFHAP